MLNSPSERSGEAYLNDPATEALQDLTVGIKRKGSRSSRPRAASSADGPLEVSVVGGPVEANEAGAGSERPRNGRRLRTARAPAVCLGEYEGAVHERVLGVARSWAVRRVRTDAGSKLDLSRAVRLGQLFAVGLSGGVDTEGCRAAADERTSYLAQDIARDLAVGRRQRAGKQQTHACGTKY